MSIRRTLDAGTQYTVSRSHTQPFHIVDLELPTGTVYLSEGPQFAFDNGTGSHTYLEGRVEVGDLVWSPEGGQSCALTIYNENGIAASWFFSNRLAEATAVIYLVHLNADNTFSAPIRYAVGSCDGATLAPEALRVNILTLNRERKFFPNTYMGTVGFNHMPQENAVVFWNNTTFVLERDFG